MHLKLEQGLFKSEVPVVIFLHLVLKILLIRLGRAANKGLLVRGFSWFVANPFIFNVLLGQNDVGHIPRTSSPPS